MSINVKAKKVSGYTVGYLIRGDARSQIVNIAVPRFFGDVDLSDLSWAVYCVNASEETDVYLPVDTPVITEDTISFQWLVQGIATKVVGNTKFAVVGLRDNDSGEVVWQSTQYILQIQERLDVNPSEETTSN